MNFKRVCLYCGLPNNSNNYSCNCLQQDWTHQYRVMDVDMELSINRQLIAKSFRNYSFNHPEGLLQYKGLPFHHILPEINMPAGLTPLYELNNLGRKYDCNIFLKNEGENPSGCFKDRETTLCLLNSKYQGLNKAVIYSSGNAAASAAYYMDHPGRQLIAFVAGDTYPEKIEYIQNHGADVIVIGDKQTTFEEGYRLFSEINEAHVFANHKYDNWSVRNPFRVQGDKTIALEIIKQLSVDDSAPVVPDYVIVPTANGSCLAGIWKGFRELNDAGIIPKLPRMIAVGIKNANPVSKAVRLRETDRPVSCDLSNVDARDTEVGSIIVAEEGYDSIEAARSVIESGGFEVELHTSDIQNALVDFLELESILALQNTILPEPASLTSLAAIHHMKKEVSLSPSEIIVPIATGDGLKAQNMLLSLLSEKPHLEDKVNQIVRIKENNGRPLTTKKGNIVKAAANVESILRSFTRLQKKVYSA